VVTTVATVASAVEAVVAAHVVTAKADIVVVRIVVRAKRVALLVNSRLLSVVDLVAVAVRLPLLKSGRVA
jgi:hypothetical protein